MVPAIHAGMGGFPPALRPYAELDLSLGRGFSAVSAQAEEASRKKGRKKTNRTVRSEPDPTFVAASDDRPFAIVGEDLSPSRSVLLTQLRKQNAAFEHTLVEVLPDVFDFARDQLGCNFLLSRLTEASVGDIQACFAATLPEASKLSSETFGNLLIQKLFDVCNMDQRKTLVAEMQPHILRLANDAHGCRVVQAAIQSAPREAHQIIVAELRKDVVSCIESKHGNHVIQKCIEQMPPDFVDFIIAVVVPQTEIMASHMYGCRVVQRLLEHCKAHQLEVMLKQILKSTPKLCKDQYGNYVIQHILQHGHCDDKKRIIMTVAGDMATLSNHRFSGNVVEKCFEVAARGEHALLLEEERKALISALFGELGELRPNIVDMLEDKFGRHVLSAIEEYIKDAERVLLRRYFAASGGSIAGKYKSFLASLQKEAGQNATS